MTNHSPQRRPRPLGITLTRIVRCGHHPQVRNWEIWTLRPFLRVYVLVVQAAAIGATVVLLAAQRVSVGNLAMLAFITTMGIVKEELTRNVERMRRRYSDTPYQNMTSAWTFAAALVLPAGLSAVVVTMLYTHLWIRVWRPILGARPWKVVFSASTVILSCHAANVIQQLVGHDALAEPRAWHTVALLIAAVVLYSVVNLGLVAGAIALLTTEHTAKHLFGTLSDALLEYATLALGALAAILLLRSPWVVVFVIPVLIVLHRNVLIRQLEEAASTDAKTGLLNATAWRGLATSEFERIAPEGTQCGILMLDLDQFKRVNETYGHLTGDQVLRTVADRIAAEMRGYDLLGRFGDGELVAFCPDLTSDDLANLGERLRRTIEQLAVPINEESECTIRPTISVGAAHYPESGADLEEVLLAADIALFAAKDSGRNRVEILRPNLYRRPDQGPSGRLSSST